MLNSISYSANYPEFVADNFFGGVGAMENIGSHCSSAWPELALELTLASNSRQSCLSHPSALCIGLSHHYVSENFLC